MDDIYVGEENNVLDEKEQIVTFDGLSIFDNGEDILGTVCDINIRDFSDEVFTEFVNVRLAAVKDGEVVATVVIENTEACYFWQSVFYGNVTCYDSNGQECSYQELQALKYDHLVVTNINIISAPYSDVFDYLWKFLDLGQY